MIDEHNEDIDTLKRVGCAMIIVEFAQTNTLSNDFTKQIITIIEQYLNSTDILVM